eukprot:TRINITY_DN10323_c0_g1_i1.p4 TRINITY_DN10323_c0_g1~~TRINITY_DN10323_c0_g1_i1.p4  ORF type:complete len:115 (-),score=6.20 TRINITY_DN10323_c0_g1_i1:760-1104(-)
MLKDSYTKFTEQFFFLQILLFCSQLNRAYGTNVKKNQSCTNFLEVFETLSLNFVEIWLKIHTFSNLKLVASSKSLVSQFSRDIFGGILCTVVGNINSNPSPKFDKIEGFKPCKQ